MTRAVKRVSKAKTSALKPYDPYYMEPSGPAFLIFMSELAYYKEAHV